MFFFFSFPSWQRRDSFPPLFGRLAQLPPFPFTKLMAFMPPFPFLGGTGAPFLPIREGFFLLWSKKIVSNVRKQGSFFSFSVWGARPSGPPFPKENQGFFFFRWRRFRFPSCGDLERHFFFSAQRNHVFGNPFFFFSSDGLLPPPQYGRRQFPFFFLLGANSFYFPGADRTHRSFCRRRVFFSPFPRVCPNLFPFHEIGRKILSFFLEQGGQKNSNPSFPLSLFIVMEGLPFSFSPSQEVRFSGLGCLLRQAFLCFFLPAL